MPSSTPKALASCAGMLRNRLKSSLRTRGGGSHGDGPSRWTSQGHQEKPNGYLFNRTPPPPGESRKWEDWELPYYLTGFLTVVILGVGLTAKPDMTIETWAHEKALERLENQRVATIAAAAAVEESG
ncbi:hypothetical protein GIB67_040151 [Kingdonia uniflora]|uniref:NADH dehydrogenase [ubiquinone] 1 beta subcomplex subunit 11, mitochondrial n=1 Tax=Kingdonia uniflora TaxID=39325 RepID=A0A7J7MUZ7_9MAGN|nr:hypothetical protein GIB67_040151 [Kingdonia uniflora]